MTSLALELPDHVIEEIAQRAADLVAVRLSEGSPYLSVGEAAEYARCKPQRIYDLLSSRRLTRFKDGSRVLVRRDELDAHLQHAT